MCKLEDSIQVGTLTLSNRLVMPPMASENCPRTTQ